MTREQMEKDARIIIANDGWGQHHAVRLAHWLLAALAAPVAAEPPSLVALHTRCMEKYTKWQEALDRPNHRALKADFMEARNDLLAWTPAQAESAAPVYPIPLNEAQEQATKTWAADDRLWTTQETVEFNLRTFARVILAALPASSPAAPGVTGCPECDSGNTPHTLAHENLP